ncbi:MAG: two-component regulator propeller domain-containing protein [Verrucomicrobiota bacterium]
MVEQSHPVFPSGCFSRISALGLLAVWLAGFLDASRVAGAELPRIPTQNPYVIKTWQTEDGLPENSATAMVQTQDGYLWFGTFNGLVRFDGLNFEVFNRANTPELPSAAVVNLHLDRKDRLWVSTLQGLVVREGNQWRRIDAASGGDNDFVRTFTERPNGDLLLTLSRGAIFEQTKKGLARLPSPPGLTNGGFLGGCDEDGRWWAAQTQFVGTWDGQRWVPETSVTSIPASTGSAFGFAPARDGGLWLVVSNDLRKYSHGKLVSVRPIPNDGDQSLGSISGMNEDSTGNVWIASYDAGLTQVLPQGGLRRWNATNGLGYKDVRFTFEDQEKNLWIGTSGGGLQRFRPRRFEAFGYTRGDEARVVYSVADSPDGSVWATTFGQGLFRWHPEQGFHRTRPPSKARENYHFTHVLCDRKGRTWVSIFSDGLLLFGAGEDRHFSTRELGSDDVHSLFEDSRGRVWISVGPGLAVFDEGRFTTYSEKDGLPSGEVNALAEGPPGILWVSNQKGVFRFDQGRFEELKPGQALHGVLCLKCDPDETLWMGTRDQGMLRWKKDTLSVLQGSSGLPVQEIHGILEDARGYFWMASNRGVVRVSRRNLSDVADGKVPTLSCQLLDLGDGLPSAECPAQGQPVCARDSVGRFWFATSKGVAVTDPQAFEINAIPPPVTIEAIDYLVPLEGEGGDRYEPRRFIAPFPNPLELPPGSREVAIRYTAASLAAPEKVRFQVMLAGDESGWRSGEGSRVEHLHSPHPHQYRFRVRAANNDGVWDEAGTELAFTVLPFYWQTEWFRVSIALLLVGSGALTAWMLSRNRVLRALEREQAAGEIRGLRETLAHSNRVSSMGQLASTLAHELNQPLGAILRNAEAGELLLGHPHPDLSEIREILHDIREDDQRAAGLIDRMRGLLKRGTVERSAIALPDLVQEVVTLTRPEAVQRGVPVKVEMPPQLPAVAGDRIQIQQVLLNLVLNSLDAMNATTPERRSLVIEVRPIGDSLIEVRVRDTGPGITPSQQARLFEPFFSTKPHGMGIGLMICHTIVESHGGSLRAENLPEGGACFSFSLPRHTPAEPRVPPT